MISIQCLSKRFGRFCAVAGLDLEVSAGEVFGFLGPNGAGKTTAMKVMVGLMRPSAGRVLVGGIDVHRRPLEAKRLIGYVPDQPFVYDKLTGREFLFFLGGLYSLEAKVLWARANELLEQFGLQDWADELLEGYSHGMRQRLVMAGALLHRPKLLVVDEPMVGLDPRGAEMVKTLFLQYARAGGCVFLSTHSLEVAAELCHRVAIIKGGRVLAQGTLAGLLRADGARGERLKEVFFQLTEDESAPAGGRVAR